MDKPAVITDIAVADRLRWSVARVKHYCRQGRFVGAVFDRTTWHWRIPLPLRLGRPFPTEMR